MNSKSDLICSMNPLIEHQDLLTRRQFFGRRALGLGATIALCQTLFGSAEFRYLY